MPKPPQTFSHQPTLVTVHQPEHALKRGPIVHIHSVYFWLWKSLDAEKRRQFEAGLDLLTRDPNVRSRHIGKPADTNRDVIERGYDYGVVLVFDNLETHNAYQAGEAHQTFLDTCSELWARVQVYDVSETMR